MPLIEETGVGVTGANSYVSAIGAAGLLEIEASSVWTNASLVERERVLILASRILDEQVVFRGTKRLTETQGLDFPTDVSTAQDLKILQMATSLLAVDILSGTYSAEGKLDIQSISLPNFSVTTRSSGINYAKFSSRIERLLAVLATNSSGTNNFITRV